MLRFFSRIRYQIAAENRAAKYTRYAIGEILLVVIGILIALQVNNWNENRIQNTKEIRILNDLQTEIKNNLVSLSYVKDKKGEIIRNGKLLLGRCGKNGSWNYHLNFDSILVSTVVSGWVLNPETGVLTDVLNSGKLDIIKSDSIRYIIASLPASTSNLSNEDEVVKQDLHNMYLPFISKNYPIRNSNRFESGGLSIEERKLFTTGISGFEARPELLLQNAEFENLLNILLLWTNYSIYHYQFLEEQYIKANNLIHIELTKY